MSDNIYRSVEHQDQKLRQTIPALRDFTETASQILGKKAGRGSASCAPGGQKPDGSLPEGDSSSTGTTA